VWSGRQQVFSLPSSNKRVMCNVVCRSLKGYIFVVSVQQVIGTGIKGYRCSFCKFFQSKSTM
jgi:hypothetical protein